MLLHQAGSQVGVHAEPQSPSVRCHAGLEAAVELRPEAGAWRIGLVDSGFSPAQQGRVADARAFVLDAAGKVQPQPAGADRLGHGSAMLAVIAEAAPAAQFCVAQVFGETGSTSSAQIAAAIDWLLGCGVRLINLSLGVRQDYPGLKEACERALAAGVVLVAASPPMGERVFPAAYPGVMAATGDGRCQPGQWSWLGEPVDGSGGSRVGASPPDVDRGDDQGADSSRGGTDGAMAEEGAWCRIGAPVRLPGHGPAGASMACAIVSGEVARFLAAHPAADLQALGRHLRDRATYRTLRQHTGSVRSPT